MFALVLVFKVPCLSDLYHLSIFNTSQKPSSHSFPFSLHPLSSVLQYLQSILLPK